MAKNTRPLPQLEFKGNEFELLADFTPQSRGVEIVADTLLAVSKHFFDQCPICLDPHPTADEHVPSRAIGGKLLTATCEDCNNRLGSRIEAELIHYVAGTTARATISSPTSGIPGHRTMRRLLCRTGADGNLHIAIEEPDPAILKMLESDEVELHIEEPNWSKIRLAILKHAYLAVCICTRSIPDNPEASGIRAELMSARDTPSSTQPKLGQYAARLELSRMHNFQEGPAVAVVAARVRSGFQPLMIALGGNLLVSWPTSETRPPIDGDFGVLFRPDLGKPMLR